MTTTSSPLMSAPRRLLSLAAFVAALPLVPSAFAQSVWNGGGGDTNWTTGANWGGTAPTAGTSTALQFAGTTQLTTNNDFAALSNFGSLTFNSGAGAFTLGGNSITLNGNIDNSASSNTQTISLAMALASGAHTVTTSASGAITISGIVSGAGSLTKANSSGTLLLSGANTYSGGSSITGGTVQLGSSSAGTAGTVGSNGSLTSSALGTGSVAVSNNSTLDLNGQTFGNRFVYTGGGTFTITNTSSSTATVSGAMDGSLNGNVISDFTFGGNNGNILWTGAISRTAGNLSMTKTGTNTATFNGTTGNVGVGTLTINGGTVVAAINNTSSGGSVASNVNINNGGTLKFDTALGTSTNGSAWAGQISGIVTLASGGTLDLNGSSGQNSRFQQLIGTGGTITNSSSTAAEVQIAARDNATRTYGGVIQNGTGSVAVTFTNTGTTNSGRINLLSGANTYTGATTISYGTLELGNANAVQNSTVVVNAASGLGSNTTYTITTTNPLAFASSIGTFTLGGLSGAGNIALTDIGRDASGATVTAATIALRIGNNNASTTYSGVISDGTVAGGSITKIGTGTTTLSGANTFTGATTVNAGTLATGATGTFGAGNVTVAAGAGLTFGNNTSIGDLSSLVFASTSSIALNFTGAETIGSVQNSVSSTFLAAGTYDSNALNSFFGGSAFSGTGSITISAVPEPATYAAIFGGLALVGTVIRRRRRASV